MATTSIPIIMTATGTGQLSAAIWAASLAQNAVASVFGIFTGFWLSYAALVLGLTHNRFGTTDKDALGTQKLFLLTWLMAVVLLTLAGLRLPLALTLLVGLVDLGLLFVGGTAHGSAGMTKLGGYVVFAFVRGRLPLRRRDERGDRRQAAPARPSGPRLSAHPRRIRLPGPIRG